MSGACFTYTDEDTLTVFRWHGGEYIDVGSMCAITGQPGIHGDDFHAYDVINVWDHAKGEPRIARTLDAFEERCREYMTRQEDEER